MGVGVGGGFGEGGGWVCGWGIRRAGSGGTEPAGPPPHVFKKLSKHPLGKPSVTSIICIRQKLSVSFLMFPERVGPIAQRAPIVAKQVCDQVVALFWKFL